MPTFVVVISRSVEEFQSATILLEADTLEGAHDTVDAMLDDYSSEIADANWQRTHDETNMSPYVEDIWREAD